MNDDLISRSALLEEYCRQNECLQNHSGDCRNCFGSDVIKTAPAVDAVIPVRCKECKHLMFSDCYGECRIGYIGIVHPDDFCSRGERRADYE